MISAYLSTSSSTPAAIRGGVFLVSLRSAATPLRSHGGAIAPPMGWGWGGGAAGRGVAVGVALRGGWPDGAAGWVACCFWRAIARRARRYGRGLRKGAAPGAHAHRLTGCGTRLKGGRCIKRRGDKGGP